jgi:hypothetical protein
MSSLFWSRPRSRSIIGAIDNLSNAVDNASITGMGGAAPRSERYDDTTERLDQLLLVCAAMWELIREKTQLTEEDLIARIAELDARDGNADSKLTQTPQKCTQCQRVISPKHQRCLYCGAQAPADTIFKTI